MSKRMDDLTGQKFGRLYVIGFGEPHIRKDGRKNTTFVCICDCGNKIVVDGVKLKNGNTKSCGCTRIEKGWAKETGIKRQTISRRLCLGWSVEDALTRNVEQRRKENNNGRKS